MTENAISSQLSWGQPALASMIKSCASLLEDNRMLRVDGLQGAAAAADDYLVLAHKEQRHVSTNT